VPPPAPLPPRLIAAPQPYAWKRFWHPRESTPVLVGGGYLPDPDDPSFWRLNPALVFLEELVDQPCLILLGEPGMGKTITVEQELDVLRPLVEARDDAIACVDLSTAGSEAEVASQVFDNPAVSAWCQASHELHLFLDSLDEGMAAFPLLPKFLARDLRKLPLDRLRLRVVCRATEWPLCLDDELRALWGADAVSAFLLAPLSRRDVALAALRNQLDSAAFLGQIEQQGLVPLASRPLTLAFLLREYAETPTLPRDVVELYERGCRRLASSEQLVAQAGRLAAVTIFPGTVTIVAGPAPTPSSLSVRDPAADLETTAQDSFYREVRHADEILSSRLFRQAGGRALWAHRAYAEYLAARSLLAHGLPAAQIAALLQAPEGRIVPLLYGVAAWLARMSGAVFDEIRRVDPEFFLAGDVPLRTDAERASLVDWLLKQARRGDHLLFHSAASWDLGKLLHPGLGPQLRPPLLDRSARFCVREVALDVAAACGGAGLLPELLRLALTADEPVSLRAKAARCIARRGSQDQRSALLPLALLPIPGDIEQDLRAFALEAVWPWQTSWAQLAKSLPQHPDLAPSEPLDRFISEDLSERLPVDDLCAALQWIAPRLSRPSPDPAWSEFADRLIRRAIAEIDRLGVLGALADALAARLSQSSESVVPSPLIRRLPPLFPPETRRRIVAALVPRCAPQSHWILPILQQPAALLTPADAPWVLQQRRDAAPPLQPVWDVLLAGMSHPNDPQGPPPLARTTDPGL
jgi:hypothetical protein